MLGTEPGVAFRKDGTPYTIDLCGCPSDRGHGHARIFPEPLRELTPETSAGFAAINFAKALGMRLIPWQRWLLIHALELLPDGTPRFKYVLLLVGRQCGKTTVASLIILLWLFHVESSLVVGAAQSLSLAEDTWGEVVELIQAHPVLSKMLAGEPRMSNGTRRFKLVNGSEYRPVASTGGAARGLSINHLFFDELRLQMDYKGWAALTKATNSFADAQLLLASNAGDKDSVVLNDLQDSAREEIYNGVTDSRTGLFEFSAPDDADPYSFDAARWGSPSLGYTVTWETLRAAHSEPLPIYRSEVLCQRVDALDAPLDLAGWAATARPAVELNFPGAAAARRLWLAIDMSPDGQEIALAAAYRLDKDSPVRATILKTWSGPNALTDAKAALPGIRNALRPRGILWVPQGPGAALRGALESWPKARVVEIPAAKLPGLCAQLAAWVAVRAGFEHDGNPAVKEQARGAKRGKVGDGWRFERRIPEDGGQVTMLYALTLAATHAFHNMKSSYKGQEAAEDV